MDLIRFFAMELQEPIPKQYLNKCPKNAIYTSTTAGKSLLDAINMREIKQAYFLCIYADEVESSSHKEKLSMFLTYLSSVKLKVFCIVNLNRKTAAQIMNVANQFFLAKNIKLDKYFLVFLMELMQ